MKNMKDFLLEQDEEKAKKAKEEMPEAPPEETDSEPEAKPKEKKPTERALINWFKAHPNPKDSVLHAWAEKQEWDVDEVESLAYRLATKYVQSLEQEGE